MNWVGDSARENMPFRQVSVEIPFGLAGVAIQHEPEIAGMYAKHMSGISYLHLHYSKRRDLKDYDSSHPAPEVSSYRSAVVIQHERR